MIELVPLYGCEVWLLEREEQRKLLTIEMDYLRKSGRVSRLQKKKIQKCKQNNQF